MHISGRTREILRTLAVFLAACLVLCLIRLFFFSLYTVSSPRPTAEFQAGDRLLVSRTSYGVRLPFPEYTNYRRLGSGTPERGDWMAFNMPYDSLNEISNRTVCIAQCLALPGDTVWLTKDMKVSRRQSKDSYPFVVPAKGRRVSITKWNARLVCNTINLHEPCHCAELKGDTLLIDGHTTNYVVFTQDYFWVFSGMQSNTDDSRSYGLAPQNHIIGKVMLILYSVKPGEPVYRRIRADRFFKTPQNSLK